MTVSQPVEPHLPLVPSVVAQGRRVRAVFSRLYSRPEKETFHEFLATVVAWTFGKAWVQSQMSIPTTERHMVAKWMQDFSDYRINPKDCRTETINGRTIFSAIAPASVSNLLQLGYDFFCLQAINRLPERLVERLHWQKTRD